MELRPQPAYFWLRTPYLSIERLVNGLSKDELMAILQDPFVREAIRLASPAFFSQLEADPALHQNKTHQTALKYVLRMGSRATPFGLFAGYTQGRMASSTQLNQVCERPLVHRRLDTTVLEMLQSALSKQENSVRNGRYFTNTGLYQVGDSWRYTEVQSGQNQNQYFLSQLRQSKAIHTVLKAARNGATRQALVSLLVEKRYEETQSHWLVEQLIQDQVLISEFSLHGTGPGSLEYLLELLERVGDQNDQIQVLRQTNRLLQQKDFSVLDEQQVRVLLTSAFSIDLGAQPLLSVNSQYADSGIQLKYTVRNALQADLEKLRKLAHLNPVQHAFEQFKERFYERYQEREMPLGLVLDTEVGVGYGGSVYQEENSIIDGLLPKMSRKKEVGVHDGWLLNQYDKWCDQGGGTLLITDSALASLPDQPMRFPESYFALGYFLAGTAEQIDTNDYQFVLKTAGGASGFDLMGRFCQDDRVLTDLIRAEFLTQQTARPNQTLAEVAHLPAAHAGAVIQRPHLCEYEIPYLSLSALPIKRQIWLADLYVSVPGGKTGCSPVKAFKQGNSASTDDRP